MTKQLIGVGMGPGDPELVTVKAVGALRTADAVLVPVMAAGEPGRAEAIARRYVAADRVKRVVFALNDRGGTTERRMSAWDAAASTVAQEFGGGAATVAFATIGDPNVYSTFTYLAQTVRKLVPDVAVVTVPGITAMQDLAARSGTVLVEGVESLALLPLTAGAERFRTALESYDTVVAYKFGGVADEVLRALEETGRLDDAVYGARLGLADSDVRPARELDPGDPVPYLSTLIAPGKRASRGGKLR